MSAPQIAKLIESWDKTFTIPELVGTTFNMRKRGRNVMIRAWISTRTFSKSLPGWTFDNDFRSSIEIPAPVLVGAYSFLPDGQDRSFNDKRYFQANMDNSDGKYYLYLYNRQTNAINNIQQMAAVINYITDE